MTPCWIFRSIYKKGKVTFYEVSNMCKKKTTIAYSVLALCLILGLTGCGKKQVDYADATEGQVDVVEDGIPKHLEYTITGEATDVTQPPIPQPALNLSPGQSHRSSQ